MPVSKKRKTTDTPEGQNGNSVTPALLATTTSVPLDTPPTTVENNMEKAVNESELANPQAIDPEIADREQGRQERFKALQARAVSLARCDVFRSVIDVSDRKSALSGILKKLRPNHNV